MITVLVAVGVMLMMLLVAAEWCSRKDQDLIDKAEKN